MDDEGATTSQPRKRIRKYGREARAARILERLRDGFACEDVAREEGLNVRRVRQIAAAAIKAREAAADLTHAHLQIDRLGFAMRVAAEAMANGDIRAIAPFVKAVGELDGYQATARELSPKASRQDVDAADRLVIAEMMRRLQNRDAPPAAARETAAPASPEVPPAPAPASPPRRSRRPRRRSTRFFALPAAKSLKTNDSLSLKGLLRVA